MYFGEREAGELPRVVEELTSNAWRGIVAEIVRRTQDGFLAQAFPLRACPDSAQNGTLFITGCDLEVFYDRMRGDHPRIATPLTADQAPETIPMLEVIEWVFQHVSEPINPAFHSYHGDYHYGWFNRESGQGTFANNINTIFRRHFLSFELRSNGQIHRIGPPVLQEALHSTVFHTEDHHLNRLLDRARQRFGDPDFHTRYDGLKDLFDAFERLKTLEAPHLKPQAATALINRVTREDKVHEMLDTEMRRDMESFGNGFFIRHANAAQIQLQTSEEIDYLFHRLFALVRFLLRSTGRAA